jgi:hypothetical protein
MLCSLLSGFLIGAIEPYPLHNLPVEPEQIGRELSIEAITTHRLTAKFDGIRAGLQ